MKGIKESKRVKDGKSKNNGNTYITVKGELTPLYTYNYMVFPGNHSENITKILKMKGNFLEVYSLVDSTK